MRTFSLLVTKSRALIVTGDQLAQTRHETPSHEVKSVELAMNTVSCRFLYGTFQVYFWNACETNCTLHAQAGSSSKGTLMKHVLTHMSFVCVLLQSLILFTVRACNENQVHLYLLPSLQDAAPATCPWSYLYLVILTCKEFSTHTHAHKCMLYMCTHMC